MDSYSIAAKWIIPADGKPLQDHFIVIKDGVIEAIASVPQGRTIDLGNCCLSSTLVNAHCHLDLSDFEEPIAFSGSFVDWLRAVIRHRMQSVSQEGFKQRQDDARLAAIQSMIESGTGTVYDIVNSLPADFSADDDRLEIVWFPELISISLERAEQTLGNAAKLMMSVRPPAKVGYSPHAPYTLEHEMLQSAIAHSRQRSMPIAMHLSESREEIQWLQNRSEPFASFLDPHSDDHFKAHGFHSVSEIIELLAGAHRSLLIHGNYLTDDEIELVAKHAERIAVVYCPRTHAAFEHPRHPIEKLLAKGVQVFLGTDSLASNPDLNVWHEARYVREQFPAIPAQVIWSMVTDGPRRFMDYSTVKSLAIGGEARFAKFDLPADKAISAQNIYEVLLDSGCEPKLVSKTFVD